jgi:hypothetical protein
MGVTVDGARMGLQAQGTVGLYLSRGPSGGGVRFGYYGSAGGGGGLADGADLQLVMSESAGNEKQTFDGLAVVHSVGGAYAGASGSYSVSRPLGTDGYATNDPATYSAAGGVGTPGVTIMPASLTLGSHRSLVGRREGREARDAYLRESWPGQAMDRAAESLHTAHVDPFGLMQLAHPAAWGPPRTRSGDEANFSFPLFSSPPYL